MKPTRVQLSKARAEYMRKREEMLAKQVSGLSIKLFDRVVNDYLQALETEDGRIVISERNYNLVQGIDKIYEVFVRNDNIPVIEKLVVDLQKTVPLNEKYFKNIMGRGVSPAAAVAKETVNRRIGVTEGGVPIKGGFVDKFIKDEKALKDIKRKTIKAIAQRKSFTDFRQEMKEYIQGDPKIPKSGRIHQYYRNYAYDSFQQADRIAGDAFAKELDLEWFIYQGGIIDTSRELCIKCNNRIINASEFKELEYDSLKEKYQGGIPNDGTWKPLIDLGGYGCRHQKDWVAEGIATNQPQRILDLSELKK